MKGLSKLIVENIEMMSKLEPQEFIGVCKILGVKLTQEEIEEVKEVTDKEGNTVTVHSSVRPTEEIIEEAVDKVAHLNRTQGRNLRKILKAATKGNK